MKTTPAQYLLAVAVVGAWAFSNAPAAADGPRLDGGMATSAYGPGLTLDWLDLAQPTAQTTTVNRPPPVRQFETPTLTLDAAAVATTNASESPAGGNSEAELAKKLQNPVADLISVPFQYNADFGIGSKNASRSTLNIQPVIPISISKDWNLIVRTILPVIYADSTTDGVSSEWGLGDTTQTFFFSPKKDVGGWIVGAGPVFLWPTATNDLLGSGKWGAGPSAILLKQENGWTYGMLANQIWSYAGASDRTSVNATFLQPFIGYTFPTFTTLTLNTESTYDWSAHQWTVPINLMLSQLVKIDNMPVQFQLGGRYYAEGPSGGPEWGMRFTITFLFTK